MKYHPAIVAAFLLEEQGCEVDWEDIYKTVKEFPPEQIDKWRQEYQEGKRPAMYEYKTMIGEGLIGVEQLNRLAEEGWELVQVIPYVPGMVEIKEGDVAIYLRRVKGVS